MLVGFTQWVQHFRERSKSSTILRNKDGRLRSVPAPTPTLTPDQYLDSDSDSNSSCQIIDDSDSGYDSSCQKSAWLRFRLRLRIAKNWSRLQARLRLQSRNRPSLLRKGNSSQRVAVNTRWSPFRGRLGSLKNDHEFPFLRIIELFECSLKWASFGPLFPKHTNEWTDGRMLPNTLSPCCTADNEFLSQFFCWWV